MKETDSTLEKASPPKKSRAGRDLKAATGVGIGASLLVCILLLTHPLAFLGLVIVLTLYAEYEVALAFWNKRIEIIYLPLAVGSAGILCCAYTLGIEAAWVATLLTILSIVLWRMISQIDEAAIRDVISTVLVCTYIPLNAVFVVLMQGSSHYPQLVALWILATVFNDTGGYAVGVICGKHPILPRVSPNKSWEGFAGSVFFTTLVVSLTLWVMGLNWWGGLLLGPIAAAVATFGDFAESLLKRNLGVKDMGNILPGHGGVMDRLDSLLFTAPLFYLWFVFAGI